MSRQSELIASLPQRLAQFVAVQDYSLYTPEDQAGWRFLMRNLSRKLAETAHPVYLEGLKQSGISLDYIPNLEEMNQCLEKLGWHALAVRGFIPPTIFMEFQARKMLVIACEMRRLENILYTPAPDIVHESAGHAPFLVDVDYAEFLQRFGEVGKRALHSADDMAVYDAIRELSIIKEDSASTAVDVDAAEANLSAAQAAVAGPSEAALLSRLHWWTVEYGLVGEPDDYKIFGAGLLSSLSESSKCLDNTAVAKRPLTLRAIATPYDITREQPQLFVTKSCRHLKQVLEEFAKGMAFKRGGAESVRKAIACRTLATIEYDSGLQISGVVNRLCCDELGAEIYIGTEGPTQIAYRGHQLNGHGTEAHCEGFGSPVGLIKEFSRCLSEYSVDELSQLGVAIGQRIQLEFVSGICVAGMLMKLVRMDYKNLMLCFNDCTVTGVDGEVLFDPSWGNYDMAIGKSISSVFGGVADPERHEAHAHRVVRSRMNPVSERAESLYERILTLNATPDAASLLAEIDEQDCQSWLMYVELLHSPVSDAQLRSKIIARLNRIVEQSGETMHAARYELEAANYAA